MTISACVGIVNDYDNTVSADLRGHNMCVVVDYVDTVSV